MSDKKLALFSCADAARECGCSEATIKLRANRIGVGRKLGRAWIFTTSDLRTLISARRPVGNPNFSRS